MREELQRRFDELLSGRRSGIAFRPGVDGRARNGDLNHAQYFKRAGNGQLRPSFFACRDSVYWYHTIGMEEEFKNCGRLWDHSCGRSGNWKLRLLWRRLGKTDQFDRGNAIHKRQRER